MTNAPLRVALVGCGQMGYMHAQTIANEPHSQFVAACDVDPESVQVLADRHRVTGYRDCTELLEKVKPDVLVVATPDQFHLDVTLVALASGCHVFCEKPLAESVAEARQMVEAAERSNLYLAVNFNRRYGFAYEQAKGLLERDQMGEIRSLVIDVIDAIPPVAVARYPEVMLTTLLTHHFDLVRFLAGEVRTVTALLGPRINGIHHQATILLQLISRAHAVITATYREQQLRTTETAKLTASRGTIMMEDVTRSLRYCFSDPDEIIELRPNLFVAGDSFQMTSRHHLRDFLARIQRGEPPSVSGVDGLRGLQIAEAARASHHEKRPVLLDP